MADLFDEDDTDRPSDSPRRTSAAAAPPWLVIALCLLGFGWISAQDSSPWRPHLRSYDSRRVVPPWEEAARLAWEQATEEERQEALRSRD
jgi:hypothetical protein